MLKVSETNFEKIKIEMKEAKVLRVMKTSFLNKQYKGQYNLLSKAKKSNELLQYAYSPSKCLPVRIGEIIINYKIYAAFIKKLKGFNKSHEIKDKCLVLTYGKKSNGVLTLEDISPYFDGFQHIPVATLDHEGGGSK